jgi:hypothetical protein
MGRRVAVPIAAGRSGSLESSCRRKSNSARHALVCRVGWTDPDRSHNRRSSQILSPPTCTVDSSNMLYGSYTEKVQYMLSGENQLIKENARSSDKSEPIHQCQLACSGWQSAPSLKVKKKKQLQLAFNNAPRYCRPSKDFSVLASFLSQISDVTSISRPKVAPLNHHRKRLAICASGHVPARPDMWHGPIWTPRWLALRIGTNLKVILLLGFYYETRVGEW